MTDSNMTVYHCELENPPVESINEACERYALMLSAPLLDPDYIQREIESVDTGKVTQFGEMIWTFSFFIHCFFGRVCHEPYESLRSGISSC